VHVSVALYLGAGSGSGKSNRKVTPEDEERSMEALANVLGPPQERFVPRVRRIDKEQVSPPDESGTAL
jgi:hypothetical protein